jgi:hypothetical protein
MNPPLPDLDPQRTALGVLSELDLAITFSELALTSSDRRAARRNMVISRQAVDSAQHFLNENAVEDKTKAEIDCRFDRLRLLFRQYSDGQTGRAGETSDSHLPSDGAPEPSIPRVALPALPKAGPTYAVSEPPTGIRTTVEAAIRRESPITGPRANSDGSPARLPRCSRLSRAVGWLRLLREINTQALVLLDKFSAWLMTRI